jgi:actin-related protein
MHESGSERKWRKATKIPNHVTVLWDSVGRQKSNVLTKQSPNSTNMYIGNASDPSKRKLYKLSYPMKNGIVEDWDDM